MSDTNRHKTKGKFNKGVPLGNKKDEMSFLKGADRFNFEWGRWRANKRKIKEKQIIEDIEIELKELL